MSQKNMIYYVVLHLAQQMFKRSFSVSGVGVRLDF